MEAKHEDLVPLGTTKRLCDFACVLEQDAGCCEVWMLLGEGGGGEEEVRILALSQSLSNHLVAWSRRKAVPFGACGSGTQRERCGNPDHEKKLYGGSKALAL